MLVTVLTVCYNAEKTIARAIESVLNQSYSEIEYILIDGASKDHTVEIAEGYRGKMAARGIRYTVISEKDNGMYDALNKGARLAQGELVGQVNSDDWYEPDAVQEMAALYEKEHYDVAWANIRIITDRGNIIKKARVRKFWTTSGFCHPTMFTRREILLQYPYACLQIDDDFDFITRVHKDNRKICTLDKVLSNYSFGGMSTSKGLGVMFERISMKYRTYRRNGYSFLYWFYCFAIEFVKFIVA